MRVHRPAPHESAVGHVTGGAKYVDDLPVPAGTLVARIVGSTHAHADVTHRDAANALATPGVVAVLFADDIPGDVRIGPVVHDEPLLAQDTVHCVGQAVALVLAQDPAAARRGASAVAIHYAEKPAISSIAEAIAGGSFLTPPHVIRRADVDAALTGSDMVVHGELSSPAQDHFYLETHVALAIPGEGHTMEVHASTQHPTEVQRTVARALGWGSHQVVCEVPRLGGGFGGKESQATNVACLAALGAQLTGRPVKLWFDRDTDMTQTGHRHPFWSRYVAGFTHQGDLLALRVQIFSDGGWSQDLSGPVMDRALFHLDSSYYVPALEFVGRVCRTNRPSSTAFRGFGGPQGMLVIEDAMNGAAERLGLDPAQIRVRNFYGDAPRNRAPYGQTVHDNRLPRIWDDLRTRSDYERRRADIEDWNRTSTIRKRGLGLQTVKFGISFTKSFLNQAGALVLVYADGTVQLNHAGTEMGQGLHTKMLAICADGLGVPVDRVRQMPTSTRTVPNTPPTAASSGADLNGEAVARACTTLRERMAPIAAQLLDRPPDTPMRFAGGTVTPVTGGPSIPFAQVASAAWSARESLFATGWYATPGIAYDPSTGRGTPFHYYAFGAAVTEVEIDTLTGQWRVVRVDILHDVGDSLVPTIDRGQIEGGFVQGLGWLGSEELVRDASGTLLTHGPSTYKIPAFGDTPLDFRVDLLDRAPADGVVHGSKAVGEPPFMLAISLVTALRHAVAATGDRRPVELSLPCTPEAILRALDSQRRDAPTPDEDAER